MTRDECIDALYAEAVKQHQVTRDEYAAMLYGWDLAPIVAFGVNVGVVMLRFHEIHMHIEPQAAMKYGRRLLKQYLLPNLQKHGYLTTITPRDDGIERFLVRLGFYKTGEENGICSYRIDQAKVH